jgi:photosystem II stability/assembly factor-like uncharacterized protein
LKGIKNSFKKTKKKMKNFLIICISVLFIVPMIGQEYAEIWRNPESRDFYEIQNKFKAYFKNRDKGRGSGYKQFKRWEMFMESRVYPSGRLFNYSAYLIGEQKKFKQSALYKSSQLRSTNGHWTDMGPHSYTDGLGWNGGQGRINCIAFHPTNSNIIYVGAPAGGLWKTTNGGTTWTCLTDGLPLIGVSGIAIRPDDPNTIYILTGDGDSDHTNCVGVLKSTNGGATWHETGLSWSFSLGVRGYKLMMHPTDYNRMFIATNNGIYRTVDGSDSWQQIHHNSVTDIEFKPGSPDTLYAVEWNNFIISYNGGNTWNTDPGGTCPTTGFTRIAIGVTPANTSYVYLLYGGGPTGYKGTYLSQNSGATFNLQSNTPNIMGYETDGSDTKHQASYDIAIAVHPTLPYVLYIGGINVWKSTDYGLTWEAMSFWKETNNSTGYTHADIHALELQDDIVFCGSDGGVFKSIDAGENWIDLTESMNIMQFYYIDVVNNEISGGTQDNGCNQWSTSSTDALHTIGADGFACLINYDNTQIRYQSDQNTKWRVTYNFGAWTHTNISPFGLGGYWSTDWIMDPVDPDILYVGHQDVYRTTTGGLGLAPWLKMNAGFLEAGDSSWIQSLAMSPENTNRLYAASNMSIRRTDNAQSTSPDWIDITSNLPVAFATIMKMAVDPSDSRRVWVCFSGLSNNNKVFYTSNADAVTPIWDNESGNLPNIPVNNIEFDPGSIDGIYIGTDFGVFYKNGGIGDWIYFSNGLPTVPVFDLDIDGSYLYAGTFGRGIWRTSRYSICPSNYSLTQANDPSNSNSTGVQEYSASGFITSSRIITGGLGTDVSYTAGDSITFLPGFHAKSYNQFVAKMGSCPE